MEFIEYNHNYKNKKTNDCVIRAIGFASGKSWTSTYMSLAQLGAEKGYMINDPKNWKRYLEILGYKKQNMPRRKDNTRYTLEEFCDELAKDNEIYIVKVAGHLTVVKDKNLYDTWNCSRKSVGNYWIKGSDNE